MSFLLMHFLTSIKTTSNVESGHNPMKLTLKGLKSCSLTRVSITRVSLEELDVMELQLWQMTKTIKLEAQSPIKVVAPMIEHVVLFMLSMLF